MAEDKDRIPDKVAAEPQVLDRTPAPKDDLDETRVKAYLKDKYGIEDDPDTFKTKRQQWEEASGKIPQYEQALSALYQRAQAYEALQQQAQAQTPSGLTPEQEAQWRQHARLEPYDVTKRLLAQERNYWESMVARLAQRMDQQLDSRLSMREQSAQVRQTVEQEYPEAFQEGSELNQIAAQVWNEYPREIKEHPDSTRMAAEQAAGRLGLAPKSRRQGAPAPATSREGVADQAADRGSRPAKDDSHGVSLTANDRRVMDAMGLDEKTFRAAKAARQAGKNLVSR